MSIISVKAGRCVRRGETNWVDPLPAKGRVEIEEHDGLLTFHWKSREQGSMAENDELIIFPGDCSFEKVESDRSGRTHVLKFSSSDSRDFYWFQDASSARDETDAFNINSLLQDPDFAPVPYLDDEPSDVNMVEATAASIPSSNVPPQTPAHAIASSSSIPIIPGAPRAQRVGDLIDISEGPSSQVPATPAASGSAVAQAPSQQFSQDQISALAKMLEQSVQNSGQPVQEEARLTDILTSANLMPILTSSPTFIHSLIPHLPSNLPLSDPPTVSEIQSIISSSQWTEAVAGFDAALRTGALVGSMGSLGMPERAGRGVGEFLEEVINQGKKEEDKADGAADKMDTD